MDGTKAHADLLRFFPGAVSAACNGDGRWATVTGPGGHRSQAQCPGCWHARLARAALDFTPPRFRLPIALPPAVAAWAAHGTSAQGLYLSGQVGTGKTHTAWAAVTAWCMQTGTLPGGPAAVIFTRMTDLLDDLRPGDDSRQRIRDCQRAALLVVDDLGAEKASEWTQERFYSIIDHRYTGELPLIVTGNLPPKHRQLAPQVGERAASRLAEMCVAVAMTGTDRRRPAS